jgi:hypothetical protein
MSDSFRDQMPNQMESDGSSFTRMPVRRLGNISQSEPSVSASLKSSHENPRKLVNAGLGAERAEEFEQ